MTPEETREVFARRVARERARQRLSVREVAVRGGLSASTVNRAENGREVWLSAALAITGALGLTLPEMFDAPECGHCDSKPPAGFSCPECGRTGTS